MPETFDVFLSHNSRDKPAVRKVAEALRDRGLKVWLDEWELIPGRPWLEALERVIESIGCAAVLVGKDGLGPWEIPEMRACLGEFVRRNLPVIPVLLPGMLETPRLPILLNQFTWVDLRAGLNAEGLDRLEWGITGKRRELRPTIVATAAYPRVALETNKGSIVIELYPDKAPKSVGNFLKYVKDGHYDNTVFHRVIANFMIQGGGFDTTMKQKATRPPIANEADNGLSNDRSTVAMARTSDPNSASTQFFINVVDNTFLNHKSKTPQGWGYTVFGKVVKGMDVADAVAAVKTKTQDVPVEPVIITKAHAL